MRGGGGGGGQSNGVVRGIASPDRGGAHDKRGTHNNNHLNDNNKPAASSDTAHDSKKGGSSSGSGDAAPPVWPPKFVIALTNKEKEEDFLAIKGSKLPQRPKKRAKFVQRTLNVRTLFCFFLQFFSNTLNLLILIVESLCLCSLSANLG